MKRFGKNTKERRIILGTNAVLADVFLDIRLHPIPNYPILKYPYEKSLKRVEAGLRDGGLETQKLWGGGWGGGGGRVWIGRSKNIRGRGKFPELAALKRIPALTYKSLQTAPISEWGAKRVR